MAGSSHSRTWPIEVDDGEGGPQGNVVHRVRQLKDAAALRLLHEIAIQPIVLRGRPSGDAFRLY